MPIDSAHSSVIQAVDVEIIDVAATSALSSPSTTKQAALQRARNRNRLSRSTSSTAILQGRALLQDRFPGSPALSSPSTANQAALERARKRESLRRSSSSAGIMESEAQQHLQERLHALNGAALLAEAGLTTTAPAPTSSTCNNAGRRHLKSKCVMLSK